MQEAIAQSFFDPDTATVTHTSADRVIEHVRQAGLTVAWLLETHAHADHLSAAPYLKAQLGGHKTLAIPRLLPAVQVNVRADQLPPPEDNGVRYLKIPINVL